MKFLRVSVYVTVCVWTVDCGVRRYPRGPTGGIRISRDPAARAWIIKPDRVFKPMRSIHENMH
jgi:hypothetical protein